MSSYISDYDDVVKAMQCYIEGGRAGKSELMRPGFLPEATIVGFYPGGLLTGSIQQLYDWIDGNGPAPNIEPRFASIDILDSIASVRLEVEHWSGELSGSDTKMSDVFTLLKTEEGWKISQKTFHWHTQ
ncbi:MAG: nuclear transport factor 2 family protein [Chloroflexi bacterium]|nr:nuclear transport factor 2 family protein [Chloroflexota bacterium]